MLSLYLWLKHQVKINTDTSAENELKFLIFAKTVFSAMCQLNSSAIINIKIDMYIMKERIAGLALALTTIQKLSKKKKFLHG